MTKRAPKVCVCGHVKTGHQVGVGHCMMDCKCVVYTQAGPPKPAKKICPLCDKQVNEKRFQAHLDDHAFFASFGKTRKELHAGPKRRPNIHLELSRKDAWHLQKILQLPQVGDILMSYQKTVQKRLLNKLKRECVR